MIPGNTGKAVKTFQDNAVRMVTYDAAKPVPKDSFLSRMLGRRAPAERVVEEGFELWYALEDVTTEREELSRHMELQSDIMLRPQIAWEKDGAEYHMQPGPQAERVRGLREDGYEPTNITFYYNDETDPLHGTLTYTAGTDTVTFSAVFDDTLPEEARDAVIQTVERFGFEA